MRTLVTAAALALSAGLLIAGPLTPPAGPVASTFKTLSETEPRTAMTAANTPGDADSVFRITSPGSYYLTGNIAGGVSGKAGIEIAASGVTIDLAGFTVDGTPTLGLPASLDGIRSVGSIRDITIRNGAVRDFGGDGLDLGSATGLVVTDITVDSCAGVGLSPGPFARVERCALLGNGDYGVYITAPGVVLRECTAAQNAATGIRTIGAATRIERCTVQGNDLHGIEVLAQAVVEDNICTSNGQAIADGAGIRIASTGARIARNHCTANDYGFYATTDNNIVYDNWASQNSVFQYDTASTHRGFLYAVNVAYSYADTDAAPYQNLKFEP